MARKRILTESENEVLLSSRRRCCLCFWLDGIDEVRPGQIAHLDGNNENADGDNLVFLCLEHHDAYDGRTSQSKGLQEREVRRWRDELYREIEYRFRTIRKHGFQVTLRGFVYVGPEDQFKASFRVKNTGEVEARSAHLAIRLLDGMTGKRPSVRRRTPGPGSFEIVEPEFDSPWDMRDSREDFFENNGRVGIAPIVGGLHPVLLPGHSELVEGLGLRFRDFKPGSEITLDYRIDAEGMAPSHGTVSGVIPSKPEDFLNEAIVSGGDSTVQPVGTSNLLFNSLVLQK